MGADSQRGTFGAGKLLVEKGRWKGVRLYLRSGKVMSCQTTQIVIHFREPPHMLFGGAANSAHEANRLVIQVQPAEGIQLPFQTKVPDAGMKLRLTDLDFRFRDKFAGEIPDAAPPASPSRGNPPALEALKPGATALDLASRGGLNLLLSARRAAPTTTSPALPMTPATPALAEPHHDAILLTKDPSPKRKPDKISPCATSVS